MNVYDEAEKALGEARAAFADAFGRVKNAKIIKSQRNEFAMRLKYPLLMLACFAIVAALVVMQVVFANYDGSVKRRTIVGKKAFVGSNATLVAPLRIGDGAFVAAGSVVTADVPDRALVIGRAPTAVRENWQNNAYTRSAEDNTTAPDSDANNEA